MAKSLQLTFKTTGNTRSTITLDKPQENLDEATVTSAMNDIVNSAAFSTKDGAYASPFSAQYVERTVTEIVAAPTA